MEQKISLILNVLTDFTDYFNLLESNLKDWYKKLKLNQW